MRGASLIAVTGGAGLLGANLALDCFKRGVNVVTIDCEPGPRLPAALACDLTDGEAATRLLEELRPGTVIHCAAAVDVDWCETHPEAAHAINVEATRRLARTANQLGARFVYISTDSVFDGSRGGWKEMDATGPVNVYAQTKLEGERAAFQEAREALIVRTCIYGWNMRPKQSLAEWLLSRLEAGLTAPAFTDIVFTPILANDLGGALAELMDQGVSGIVHVAGSEAVTKYEFAARLAATFGLDGGLVRRTLASESGLRAPRPRDASLDVSRAERLLGRPAPGVSQGLRRFKALRDSGYVEELRALGRRRAHAGV